MERLKALLAQRQPPKSHWIRGYIPNHYKRLSISMKEAIRLASFGSEEVTARFPNDRLYFTQSLIAGAILSRRFHTITICTPSQYGKSWTLGRVCIAKADMGYNTYVAAATGELTKVIMDHFIEATQSADQELQTKIVGVDLNEIQRLGKTSSKKRVSIVDGGFTEAISLADTFADKKKTGAMGKGDDYVVDEAALVSPEAFGELGRRDFAGINGERKQLVMISNPHKPGFYYDHLTEQNPDEGSLIIWADILTAVEEGEFTEEQVLTSDFAKNPSERTRYLMCELESTALSMFDQPVIDNEKHTGLHFLGVDAATTGKDKITLCHTIQDGGMIHVAEVVELEKDNWDDATTPKEIIESITRVYNAFQCPMMCVDTGEGMWLQTGLTNNGLNSRGLRFGSQPTPERKKANQYAATNALNLRAEMHLDLQDLISTKHITFSEQAYNAIKEVLPLISMTRQSGGKVKIRPKIEIKNEIGHSPDEFDSVLLSVHAAILYNAEN